MIRNLVAAEGVNMRQTLYVSFGITAAWPSHVAVAGDEGLQGQFSFYRPIVRFGQLKIERVLHPWRLDGHWDHFSTVKRMSLPQKMPTNRNSPRPMVLLMLAVRPRWSWSRRRWCPLAASVINARNPHWAHNSKVSHHNTAFARCAVLFTCFRGGKIPRLGVAMSGLTLLSNRAGVVFYFSGFVTFIPSNFGADSRNFDKISWSHASVRISNFRNRLTSSDSEQAMLLHLQSVCTLVLCDSTKLQNNLMAIHVKCEFVKSARQKYCASKIISSFSPLAAFLQKSAQGKMLQMNNLC